MDINIDEETRQKLEASAYAQAVTGAILHLGKATEIALNLRDRAVIEEMEAVCSSMFSQAKAILDEQRNVQ